jgi:hypothetical protein
VHLRAPAALARCCAAGTVSPVENATLSRVYTNQIERPLTGCVSGRSKNYRGEEQSFSPRNVKSDDNLQPFSRLLHSL